jgi:hypothetical protein
MPGNQNTTAPIILSLRDYEDPNNPDAQPAMKRAIEAARAMEGSVILDIPPGCYHFYPQSTDREAYYISNTTSEEENPDVTKTIGIWLKDLHHVTLEGNGALFVFHGKQTMLVLDGCTDIEIRNLHWDYAAPTVTEMTVERCGNAYLEATVHPDSRYDCADGTFEWVGEGWRFREGPMQLCSADLGAAWRVDNWLERVVFTEELSPRRLRFHFGNQPPPHIAPGTIVQMRDGIRDQVGMLITQSSGVTFSDVGLHFMHGLGVVGQFSANLTFERLDLTPRPETGRTVAGFADFIHLSGCRGKVSIRNSRFAGAHDDAINVHGTYLRIVGRPASNQLLVRFMHPQTYGFSAFLPKDEVAFVNADTLNPYASGRVAAVAMKSPREWLLTLENAVPADIGERDVLENLTWTPEVEIVGNTFVRIPTRGILATTPRRIVIRDNTFLNMKMSAILVAADASSWYESGAVTDMSIVDNRFVNCGGPGHAVIRIEPENKHHHAAVHRNIRIACNRFETTGEAWLTARSTEGLIFQNNVIRMQEKHGLAGNTRTDERVLLEACMGTNISCNDLEHDELK